MILIPRINIWFSAIALDFLSLWYTFYGEAKYVCKIDISESSPDGQRSCQSLVVLASRTETQKFIPNAVFKISQPVHLNSFHHHLFLGTNRIVIIRFTNMSSYIKKYYISFLFTFAKRKFYLYKYGLKLMHV